MLNYQRVAQEIATQTLEIPHITMEIQKKEKSKSVNVGTAHVP